jgi:hypothetical protein
MPNTESENAQISHFVLRRAVDWRSKKSVAMAIWTTIIGAGGHAG